MNKQPNIVYIFSDQHNPAMMGHMGDPIIRTPNMDRMAAEGATGTNSYCNSPICVPSRSSMLTSAYPQEIGVLLNDHTLSSGWPTVAHSLGAAGYESGLSGRMHFIGADQRHGFEKRLVGDFTWSYPGGRAKNHEEIWEGPVRMTYGPNSTCINNSGGGSSSILDYDRDVTDATMDFLKNRTDERPLFLTVGLFGPHAAFVCPPEYFDYYYDKVEVPDISEEKLSKMHKSYGVFRKMLGIDKVTTEDIRRCKAAYYGMVEYIDDLIGDIVKAAEETIGLENTIFVYSANHCESIGDKGLFFKMNYRESAVKVPFLFKWDNHIKPGTRLNNLTSLLDIAPTLIEFGGGQQLPGTRGESLAKCLCDGTDAPENRSVISQIIFGKALLVGPHMQTRDVDAGYKNGEDKVEPKESLQAMIREHQYKLIMHGVRDDHDYE